MTSNNIKNQSKNENESEKEIINNEELIDKQIVHTNSPNNNQTDDLKDKWELILSKLELPSTRMLLSQQAELASTDSNEVLIALTPNWENMIKSRKIVIENAVKKVFGDQIKLNFISKKIKNTNLTKSQGGVINNPIKNKLKQISNVQNSTKPSEKSQEGTKKSSKNLANFFNGEIIDLNE